MTNEDLAYIFRSPEMGGALAELLCGEIEDYTRGSINLADARFRARRVLARHDVDPFFLTEEWLNLFFDTHSTMAHSRALMAADTEETLDCWPAWRLESYGSRPEPCGDWAARWNAAGQTCGWEGASRTDMVALKKSPIWQALGEGAGGFRDTLGNPYPPFVVGSRYNWTDIDSKEAEALELFGKGKPAPPPVMTPARKEIAAAAQRLGPEFLKELMAELEG